jgi:hypothetical protein
MDRDILLLCYYSSCELPRECWMGLSNDIAHRNMFLRSYGDVIHFEFPAFEDHSYNSICYGDGIKSLIKHESENEKYIIFRTRDQDSHENHIVGYYKVGKAYYQEIDLFDSNGFIWGIEAEPAHLIRKGLIESEYQGRNYVSSWHDDKWNYKLNKLIDIIDKNENVSDCYQKETNHVINIFQDKRMIEEWKASCNSCRNWQSCRICRYFKYIETHDKSNMFDEIHDVYTSNLYSRNVLHNNKYVPKKYIEILKGS